MSNPAHILLIEDNRMDIELTLEAPADLPEVAMDRVQIQQVVVNLLQNAMEAMQAAKEKLFTSFQRRRIA